MNDFLHVILVTFTVLVAVKWTTACPGYCTDDIAKCKEEGGVIVGQCSLFEFCCDNSEVTRAAYGTCGAVKSRGLHPYLLFQSPEYPGAMEGNLLCTFAFELEENVIGVLLRFYYFHTDSMRIGSPMQYGCDLDVLYIRGFYNWAPPGLCGDLSGYKLLIDDNKLQDLTELRLIALMSSPRHVWSIKITQIKADNCINLQPPPPPPPAPERKRKRRSLTYEAPQVTDDDVQEPKLEPFMIGGSDISTVEGAAAPWVASIRLLQPADDPKATKCDIEIGKHLCTATIISDREVLTHAGCFLSVTAGRVLVPLASFMVRVGSNVDCDYEPLPRKSQVIAIETVIFHYAYDHPSMTNQIAVVRLAEPIVFTNFARPIGLANSGEEFIKSESTISGWGSAVGVNDVETIPAQLQHAPNLVIATPANCEIVLATRMKARSKDVFKSAAKFNDIPSKFICARSKVEVGDLFMTAGDMGAPLVSTRAGTTERVLSGVVTSSINTTAIYVDKGGQNSLKMFRTFHISQSVAHFRRWIDMTMCLLRMI